MKTLRIYLCALALILAVGAAVASSLTPDPEIFTKAYLWIDEEGTLEDDCFEITVTCQDTGVIPCTVTGVSSNLRRFDNISTMCGPQLFKSPQ